MNRNSALSGTASSSTTWWWSTVPNTKVSIAAIVTTAQLVVRSSRVRQVFERATSPRYRWTMAVVNSDGLRL